MTLWQSIGGVKFGGSCFNHQTAKFPAKFSAHTVSLQMGNRWLSTVFTMILIHNNINIVKQFWRRQACTNQNSLSQTYLLHVMQAQARGTMLTWTSENQGNNWGQVMWPETWSPNVFASLYIVHTWKRSIQYLLHFLQFTKTIYLLQDCLTSLHTKWVPLQSVRVSNHNTWYALAPSDLVHYLRTWTAGGIFIRSSENPLNGKPQFSKLRIV